MTQESTTYQMKLNLNWIVLLLAVTLILGFIVFHNKDKRNSKPEKETIYQTDTVYVDRFIQVEPEFNHSQKPQTVTIYKTDTVEVEKVLVVRDTVTLILKDSSKLDFNSNFLTQFPSADKLIQMKLNQNNLQMSLVNTQGIIFSKAYMIDTRFFNYNYVNNNLTWKRKSFFSRIQPLAQTTVRPFKNMYDLDLGLKYNTSKFVYELGINLHYYPKLQNNIDNALYFRLQYEF